MDLQLLIIIISTCAFFLTIALVIFIPDWKGIAKRWTQYDPNKWLVYLWISDNHFEPLIGTTFDSIPNGFMVKYKYVQDWILYVDDSYPEIESQSKRVVYTKLGEDTTLPIPNHPESTQKYPASIMGKVQFSNLFGQMMDTLESKSNFPLKTIIIAGAIVIVLAIGGFIAWQSGILGGTTSPNEPTPTAPIQEEFNYN